jgi:hypothetical protein
MGYGHIAASHAERIQRFYSEYFNPYLNFHRPYAQPDIEIDDKGRQWRRYRRYQTPLGTLIAIPQLEQFLRSGVSVCDAPPYGTRYQRH